MSANKRRIAVLGSRSVGMLLESSTMRVLIDRRPFNYSLCLPPFHPWNMTIIWLQPAGKSSLIIQYCQNEFVESYYPTIESTFAKTIDFKSNKYDCEIIDTAGQDEFSILNSKHAIGIHGYVYSVSSRNSFDMIQIVYDKIIDFCGVTNIPCVIVGSKVDLEKSRQVKSEEGQKLAKTNDAAWVETSAKSNINVAKVFELCLSEIEKRTPNNQAEPPANRCIIM
ncbi:ras family-domain-containing protein [Mycena latifolia]|nr:ras family-domain-containing protein [Mycena latifolia]